MTFPNQDPIFHNVFSLSRTRSFDLGYYPLGRTRSIEFKQPGVVQVYCHLHANMYGAIVVAPSHFYAQPNKYGAFLIPDIPAGNYQIVAWHASAGFFRKRIHVPETGALAETFTIPLRDDENNK